MPDVCVLALGLVAGFIGCLFCLIAVGAPAWRAVQDIPGQPTERVFYQGVWDICLQDPGSNLVCQQQDPNYFAERVVQAARGLMVTAVILCGLGWILGVLGVRCWRRNPQLLVAGLGGVALFCGGVFALIPLAWYAQQQNVISKPSGSETRIAYAVILGFIGSSFELIAGLCLIACLPEESRRKRRIANPFVYPRHVPTQREGVRTVDGRLNQ